MRTLLATILITLLTACSSTQDYPPLPRPDHVDLQRFMGDWYVIGFIPLAPEKDAHNGIESYELAEDGRINTTYRFRDGSFEAPLKTFTPTAWVVEGSNNSQWKMQFIWPFKADYRIAYLAPDYSVTIIARQSRDYVWLLAREPELAEGVRQDMERRIAAMGYSMEQFIYQPQRWPEDEKRPPLSAD